MSHFTVAVFTNGKKTVDELLAPYDENLEVAPYVAQTKQELIEEAKGHKKMLLEGFEKNPNKKVEDWMTKFLEAETDEEFYLANRYDGDYEYNLAGDRLSTYNPNSKWDWYSIGGRWSGLLKAKIGRHGEKSFFDKTPHKEGEYDSALVKDLDFSIDQTAWNKAIRFWEVYIEGSPLCAGEDEEQFHSFFRKEYYTQTYGDKETYAKCCCSLSTFAVVTPDGVWHEKGSMGWFGISSESPNEALDWELHFKERFLDTADPEWTLTIVDCHI